MEKKIMDEWDKIRYPDLNDIENEEIRIARRKGFALFYPSSGKQGQLTLRDAREFMSAYSIPSTNP